MSPFANSVEACSPQSQSAVGRQGAVTEAVSSLGLAYERTEEALKSLASKLGPVISPPTTAPGSENAGPASNSSCPLANQIGTAAARFHRLADAINGLINVVEL